MIERFLIEALRQLAIIIKHAASLVKIYMDASLMDLLIKNKWPDQMAIIPPSIFFATGYLNEPSLLLHLLLRLNLIFSDMN